MTLRDFGWHRVYNLTKVRETVGVSRVNEATVSIRDLRLKFPEIREQIREYGEVIITDNGVPSYVLKLLPKTPAKEPEPVDYWARLSRQKSKPLTAEQTKSLHEENRGD